MPFFSGYVGSSGRQIIIEVLIGPPQGDVIDLSQTVRLQALVDTGATNTCISPKVVENLNLFPEGKRSVQTPTQTTDVNLYHVSFHIPITRGEGDNIRVDTHSSPEMEVTEIVQPPNYDVLVGMDVLATCSLFIAHGRFTLGY